MGLSVSLNAIATLSVTLSVTVRRPTQVLLSSFFFVSFVLINTFILFNVFVAVLIEKMMNAEHEQDAAEHTDDTPDDDSSPTQSHERQAGGHGPHDAHGGHGRTDAHGGHEPMTSRELIERLLNEQRERFAEQEDRLAHMMHAINQIQRWKLRPPPELCGRLTLILTRTLTLTFTLSLTLTGSLTLALYQEASDGGRVDDTTALLEARRLPHRLPRRLGPSDRAGGTANPPGHLLGRRLGRAARRQPRPL